MPSEPGGPSRVPALSEIRIGPLQVRVREPIFNDRRWYPLNGAERVLKEQAVNIEASPWVEHAGAAVSLYKQLEPFAEVAGLAIGDPAGQRFSSTEQQQYTTITTIGHEC